MPTLLQIDSSPRIDASVSRALSSHFVDVWKAGHPGGTVVPRDLAAIDIPPVSATWIAAAFTPAENRTPEQRAALQLSDRLVAELKAADEYVISVPMYNFGIPAVLKLWIDQIARAGETFAYVDGAPKGLLTGKKATFLTASGGSYDEGTALASFNFVAPYLRTVFAFLGVTDSSFINAGGTAALNYGADREALMQPHLDSIKETLRAA
jgi:FMN-dependent NADH-azoreductase